MGKSPETEAPPTQKVGVHGMHSCIPGVPVHGASQSSLKTAADGVKRAGSRDFGVYAAEEEPAHGNPLLRSQEARNDGCRMGHVTAALS